MFKAGLKRVAVYIIMGLFPIAVHSQSSELRLVTLDSLVSFRGMSVPNDSVVWLSGSKGAVYRSVDGGNSFLRCPIIDEPAGDFRSVYAFDNNVALVANTGSPAGIYRTTNGGTNWVRVYENTHKDAFLDGIDFWNEKEGICYGDPIMGKMLILRTDDGGISWRQMIMESSPVLVDDEASFAASGTAIRCFDSSKVMIATGGALSRILVSDNKGNSWRTWLPPIIQGESSQGIFSFDFKSAMEGIVVGGDHKSDSLATKHVYYTFDGGITWHFPETPTRGYRECVEYISGDTAIAIGPSGLDISYNGGKTWNPFSEEKKLHVIRKARTGNLIVVAGGGGKVGVLKYK